MMCVKQPTYEITGRIDRFDERDTVFARETLVTGAREEIDYHKRNPHLKEIDTELSRFITDKMDRSGATWGRVYYQTGFSSIAHLGLPDCVDGLPSPGGFDLTKDRNTELVRNLAHYLGADLVNMGPLKPEWVYSHRGTRPFFDDQPENLPLFEGMPEGYTGRLWGDAIEIGHANAISLGFAQNLDLLRAGPSEASDLEIGRVYAKSALVACQLASFIRSMGYPARAHHVRNYCVLAVPVAVDAGMGELARSGHLLHKTYGLNLRLSTVTTDLPLNQDQPVDDGIQAFCERCLKCARTCPVAAIPAGDKTVVRGVRKWQIDPERCLGYWSRVGAACVICQTVCPWSKPPSLFHKTVAHIASRASWMTRALVYGDDLFYGKRYESKKEPGWMCRSRVDIPR
jgi:reductive dehalogenase